MLQLYLSKQNKPFSSTGNRTEPCVLGVFCAAYFCQPSLSWGYISSPCILNMSLILLQIIIKSMRPWRLDCRYTVQNVYVLYAACNPFTVVGMTSIVQITTQMAAVTRAVTVRSVAGTVWTVLVTKLRSWQKGP